MQGVCMKRKYFTLTTLVKKPAIGEHFKHTLRSIGCQHCNPMQVSQNGMNTPTIEAGFELETLKGNDLICMLVKRGSMEYARQVFDKMAERNIISWNAMIKRYAKQGFGEKALQLFREMQPVGIKSDQLTFIGVVRACACLSDLEAGKQIHSHTIKTGFQSDVFVGSALVDMYAKCESFGYSRQVFDRMPERDMVSWNTLIAGYSRMGYVENAFELFSQMQEEGMKPDQFAFGSILRACASLAAAEEGEQVHAQIIKVGFESDVFVGSILVDKYAKSGRVESAWQVFDKMSYRDVVTWTTMIAGYAQNGHTEKALDIFLQMQLIDVTLNQYTFTNILSAFVSSEALNQGKQVHAHSIKIGFGLDVSVGNSLLTMYCKCRCAEDARQGFDKMSERDMVTWTAMIAGYAWNGYGVEALKLFRQMHQAGINMNQFTLTAILSAFVSAQFLEQGKQVHTLSIKTGLESHISVGNTLISMYAKCGSTDVACQVFDNIVERDGVSWNAMISGYAQNGHGELALELFCKMQRVGLKSNQFTFASVLEACASLTAFEKSKQVHAHIIKIGFQSDISMGIGLIDVYGKCGKIDDAQKLFDKIPQQNIVSWNVMIGACVQNEHGEEALNLFSEMQSVGMEPNQSTYASVLRACASLTSMEQGKQVHALIIKTGFESDVFVGSALVDMYAKCGCVEDARKVFRKMPEQNVVAWNVMITGCAQHGCGEEVLQLFEQMQQTGLKPNHITFVGVLYACCHVGLVIEGLQYFDSMNQDHGISPSVEHYACIVDLLGRAGRLTEAGEIINQMPFDPDALIWQTFLGACRIHGNIELGKYAAEFLFKLQPQNAATYVLLSNIYAAAGRWDDVGKLRKIMKDRNLKKDPGCSWIEVKNRVHSFVVEDRSHPQSEEIYAKLEELNRQMIETGYKPDTSFVLRDVE